MNLENKKNGCYPKCTRREFGVMLGFLFPGLAVPSGKVMASYLLQPSWLTLEKNLEIALRVIGSDVTVAAADDFANRPGILATLDLHLRNAKIKASDVQLIANAFNRAPFSELARLGSFSLSFNAIGNKGARALSNALPNTLKELGLVGCSIGDQGGGAILEWAKYANRLRMICIEDNSMSDQLRKQFIGLKGMSVFV